MTRQIVFLFLAVTAISSAQVNPAEKEIRATRERSNRALAARDVKALADTLASDFVQVRGSGAFTATREASIESLAKSFTDPKAVTYRRTTDKIEVSSAAPLAAEHGHWDALRPDGVSAYGGTYLAMWRLTESGWKLRSELFVWLDCHDPEACAEYRKTIPAAH
jgi:ketosteroid isomerase-like protein